MPEVNVRLRDYTDSDASYESRNDGLPELLKTPSGTVMLEIQGIINVGESPLIRTELDLGPDGPPRPKEVKIGEIDLSRVSESGCPVKLMIGESQVLRGQAVKLRIPLALLEVSNTADSEMPVTEIITHKVVFSARPEPVLSQSI